MYPDECEQLWLDLGSDFEPDHGPEYAIDLVGYCALPRIEASGVKSELTELAKQLGRAIMRRVSTAETWLGDLL